VARIAAEAIGRRTGHTVVVEVRSGALGFIALQALARAVPDGHTVGICIIDGVDGPAASMCQNAVVSTRSKGAAYDGHEHDWPGYR
jgi:tripartite-type tricarboxylate transporter receptor subunit TctC